MAIARFDPRRWITGNTTTDPGHLDARSQGTGRDGPGTPGAASCRRCRERPQRTAATWTVLVEDISRGWASDLSWDDQPRPERAGPSQAVPEPFRGQTLEERHPTEPAAHYTSEAMRLLCPLCGVPEICRAAHLRGALHGERADAERIARINRLGDRDLERAIALVQRRRPDPSATTPLPATTTTTTLSLICQTLKGGGGGKCGSEGRPPRPEAAVTHRRKRTSGAFKSARRNRRARL
ncbi:hypothetical protein HPB47_014542 [Ixodes persulcatus]|uniref:Uncharacterized protein n=1 Tax=Ixodes persulcatus TaxID=34615 RepID=A0AC60QWW9_IXOPE|nr:hypothetical protein HPB47_014542 [Ixodes persulcatus]